MNPFDLAQSAVESDRSLHDVSPVYAELSAMAEAARENPNARVAVGVPDGLDGIEIGRRLEAQAESERLHAQAERLTQYSLAEITRESIGFTDSARVSQLLDLARVSHSRIALATAENALRSFTSAAESPIQWGNLIIAKISIGDVAGAHAMAVEELGVVPEAAQCWEVLSRNGFYEEAIEHIQRTIDELPDNTLDWPDRLRSRIAMIHLHHDDVGRAQEAASNIHDRKIKFYSQVDIAEHTKDQTDYEAVVEMTADPTFATVVSDMPLSLAAQFHDMQTIDALLDRPTASEEIILINDMIAGYCEWPCDEMKQKLLRLTNDLADMTAESEELYNQLLVLVCYALVAQGELANARVLLKSVTSAYQRNAILASIFSVEHDEGDIVTMKTLIKSPFMNNREKLDALRLMLETVPTTEMLEFVKEKIPSNFMSHGTNARNLAGAIAAAGDYEYAEGIATQIRDVSARVGTFIDLAGISREQAEEYDRAHALELTA